MNWKILFLFNLLISSNHISNMQNIKITKSTKIYTMPFKLYIKCLAIETTIVYSGVAFSHKNPGSIRKGNGEYYKYDSYVDGLQALYSQLELYISTKSRHTDSTTTLEQYGKIYAEDPRYGYLLAKLMNVPLTTKVIDLDIDELLRAHLTLENIQFKTIIYDHCKTSQNNNIRRSR